MLSISNVVNLNNQMLLNTIRYWHQLPSTTNAALLNEFGQLLQKYIFGGFDKI